MIIEKKLRIITRIKEQLQNDANKIKANKREANDSSKKTYQRTEKVQWELNTLKL